MPTTDALSVAVRFCSSAVACPGAPPDLPARVRANAPVRDILTRLGNRVPRFAGGRRLLIVHDDDGGGGDPLLEELTSAQALRGGERLLVMCDREPAFEQGRPCPVGCLAEDYTLHLGAVHTRAWEHALPEWLMGALEAELAAPPTVGATTGALDGALAGDKMHTWW
jgi:hypothetical protein